MAIQQESIEQSKSAVYQQVGGIQGVSMAIRRFYNELSSDPVLHPLFRESDLNWLATRQVQFVAERLGAPIRYKGPEMKQVHAFLGVKERHRWIVERHLAESFAEVGIVPALIGLIVALVQPI